MYFPTRIVLTMIFVCNPPPLYILRKNLTSQRKEIDSSFTYVYTAKYENQYSVVLLNCHSSPLTVTVFCLLFPPTQGSILIQTYYNGLLVNLTMERQPETVIWPTVMLVYLIVLIVFLIIVVHRDYFTFRIAKRDFEEPRTFDTSISV